ncbi:domain found in Dishevelled, Egl-10, and Pleckstrin-domain-containing protein [Xylariaceae sp. FL0804]|nr:domain found in Dishevelled, Egl-10, and Pleckstrin-domain-containing protein [Xylariaceae sp. FL0804]
MSDTAIQEDTSADGQLESCIELYRVLLLALGNSKCRVVVLGQVNVERALEEYGRLKLWSRQTKPKYSADGRSSSLDFLLRHEPEIHQGLLDVLNQLVYLLGLAIPIAQLVHVDSDVDSQSDQVSTSSFSFISDRSSENSRDSSKEARPKAPKIKVLLSHLYEQIQSLYHLGSLLRRPGLSGRYPRSSKESPISTTELYDLSHIEEKLRQWNALGGAPQSRESLEEDAITESVIEKRAVERDSDHSANVLCHRFAKANLHRRQQLRYWAEHPYQLQTSQNLAHELPDKGGEAQHSKQADGPGLLVDDEGSAAKGSVIRDSKSLTSNPTNIETSSDLRSRTIYAESVVVDKMSAGVPPVPVCLEAQFECPYCHMNMDSATMKDRMVWKRHVFRDLRPYSCTFPDCSSADKLYATRYDWMYHEMQMHRRNWKCAECDEVFEAKQNIIAHLQERHPNSWTPTQLLILLDLSERPVEESNIFQCPLCPNQMLLNRLMVHLAEHLEEIALFVLPRETDSHEGLGSNQAANTASHQYSPQSVSDRNSPAISEDDTGGRPGLRQASPSNLSLQILHDEYVDLSKELSSEEKITVWSDSGPDTIPETRRRYNKHGMGSETRGRFTTPNLNMSALAEAIQQPIEAGGLRLYYHCFTGAEMTTWLLHHFEDLDTREDAVSLGSTLMFKLSDNDNREDMNIVQKNRNRGIFVHVEDQHDFRDGAYFYQIAPPFQPLLLGETPKPRKMTHETKFTAICGPCGGETTYTASANGSLISRGCLECGGFYMMDLGWNNSLPPASAEDDIYRRKYKR